MALAHFALALLTAVPTRGQEPGPDERIEPLRHAAELIGLELTEAELELMAEGVFENLDGYRRTRALKLANDVAPALGLASFLDAVSGAHPPPEPVMS